MTCSEPARPNQPGYFVVASRQRGFTMFERVFQWTVRNGSRVLFAVAALVIAVSLFMNMLNAMQVTHTGSEVFLLIGASVLVALKDAMLPLVAAIVIEHFRPRAV